MARPRWIISLTLLATVWAWPALATTNYIYPLDSWRVSTTHGEALGDDLYHMGIDAGNELSAGAAVYAVADGIVREAQERTQFGLVVLIEHFPQDEPSNVSLYGHLDPTDVRVVAGQSVKAGDMIGVLGDATNNGGWNPHLHFGIHKEPYTGEWVYYGHVQDLATAEEWYDPVLYIPEHLLADTWVPTVALNISDGAIVGTTADFTVTARDIGSRVKKVAYRISADDGASWTIVDKTFDPAGDIVVQLPLDDYADGPLLLKATVRDYFDQTSETTVAVVKDPQRYTSPAFVAMKAGKSDAFITQWSFGATPVFEAFFPFSARWSQGGDVTLGDVTGDGTQKIIAGRGSPHHPGKIKIFNQIGELLTQFKLDQFGSIRLTTGDMTGDGIAEIVIASGQRDVATVTVRDDEGQELWSAQPLGATQPGSFDVITGNIDDDVYDEVVAVTRAGLPAQIFMLDHDGTVLDHFYPFRKSFTGGANIAMGDVNGDGQNDIIVGSEFGQPGTVKIFDLQQKKLMAFRPFGDDFIGAVDVTTTQWDLTEDELAEDELIVSQASGGQAWVKAYRLSVEPEVLLNRRVYEPEFEGGTRIVGTW